MRNEARSALVGLLMGTMASYISQPAPEVRLPQPFLPAGEVVDAPRAFAPFCLREPEQCREVAGYGRPPFDELEEVNRLVNAIIRPATDLELYGEVDYWAIPVDAGDCEDYALLKRKMLIELGWPSKSLLMTVVRKGLAGEGHAVLIVRTEIGDMVLDCIVDAVMIWHRTAYEFVSRQSEESPQIWVSLE